jgi:Asp-tRNA(Asn)/Glu-tRNA(Gln) amidotransferase A subunit family amidase
MNGIQRDEAAPGNSASPTRRAALKSLAALGIGSAVFQRALAAQAGRTANVTAEMIQQAEWIAGIELSEADRKAVAGSVNGAVRSFEAMRGVKLDNSVPPAMIFQAEPGRHSDRRQGDKENGRQGEKKEANGAKRPDSDEALAFTSVADLGRLLQAKQVSSVELTKLSLERLRKYDPALRCVVSYTEELALKQAEQADKEIAAGKHRGPLHGIPWGAKDLIAYPGYKTTWGAAPFKDQVIDTKATVAKRLEDAGAVLVAKLTLGALAMGDKWFGGMTRNPWNPKQGSSGSSAGSCSATAAGLVGFGIGSETLGSIVSPCRVNGTSGLRPTFGRVSRHGCMALSWSMDKLGPIARSLEDCALVFAAIHGADGLDPTAVDRPFQWPCPRDVKSLKVGYFENAPQRRGGTEKGKDEPVPPAEREELKVLRSLGVTLVPIKLPDKLPVQPLLQILNVEAATAFDDLTRKGITEGLNTWPNTFRQGQFVPAVEYLRANRIRTLLKQEMEKAIADVDLYVGGNDLLITNLTGHPTIVLPNGFRKNNNIEQPFSITFSGRLFGESELLAVGIAYQHATGHHLKHPDMAKVTVEAAGG